MISENKTMLYVRILFEGFALTAWLIIMVMMVWISCDVVAQLFNYSLPDTINWTEILNVLALGLPVGYVTFNKRHIVVDLIRIDGKAKFTKDIIVLLLTFLFTAFLAWQLSSNAWHSIQILEYDQLMTRIYWFPAKIGLALGFISSAIVSMFQLIGKLRRKVESS